MFLKFGSAGKLLFSKAIGVSLAVMLSLSLAGVPAVKAEQSDEMRELIKKQKLKSKGLLGSYTPSTLTADPAPSGKAVTETEIFSTQVVEPMLSLGGAAEMQAAESKYAAIVSNGGWPKVPKGAYKKGSEGKGVMALNQRLFIEGYVRPEAAEGEFASIFTTATQDGLMRFQRNNGLAASGQMDGATLQALNVSAAERLSDNQGKYSPHRRIFQRSWGSLRCREHSGPANRNGEWEPGVFASQRHCGAAITANARGDDGPFGYQFQSLLERPAFHR